jgi:SNF2 family DNA or RNA helicase
MALRVVHVERHLFGISGPYSDALVEACRRVPGTHWEPAARAWVGYADAIAAVCRILAADYDLEVEDADELTPDFDPSKVLPLVPIAEADLRPSQRDGVRFLLRKAPEGALLAWAMGCGKSATVLRTIRALKIPALVVCPNHARGVWGDGDESQIKKWYPEAWPPRMLNGTRPMVPNAIAHEAHPMAGIGDDDASTSRRGGPPITVIHYDILHAWAEWLINEGHCKFIVFDECHALVNAQSRRSKAAKLLARTMSHRVGLSGTPIPNHVRDAWNIFDTLSEDRFGWFHTEPPPGGKRFSFSTRYCAAHREQVTRDKLVWKFDGSSNEEELHYRLGFFASRLTKAAIAAELPPQTRQILDIQVKRVAGMEPQHAIRGGKLDAMLLRRSLEVAADAKIPHVIELVRDHALQGEKIVVFTYRRSVAEEISDALAADGITSRFVHGGLSLAKRQDVIASQPQVLAATIDTTSTGIDLTFASTAVFAEMTYEPWELAQAEARLHRPGAKRNVLIMYPIARGSIDELIRRSVISKIDTIDKVIDGGKGGSDLRDDLVGAKEKSGKAALKSLYEAILAKTNETAAAEE